MELVKPMSSNPVKCEPPDWDRAAYMHHPAGSLLLKSENVKSESKEEPVGLGTMALNPPPPQIDIQIRNVVTAFTLRCHVDLRKMTLNCCHVYYERSKGVLVKQMRRPKCLVKIWSSGKVTIVGCKSEEEARICARRIARITQKCFPSVRLANYKVTNVMATCRLPFGVRVEKVNEDYPEQTQYEPELSIGLIWRSREPKATLRIHTTGSITITGATSTASVLVVLETLFPILERYQCTATSSKQSAKRRRAADADSVDTGPFADEDDDEDEDWD